jgi:eukaryotic-like serine/threonine-protein kinase
LALAGRWAAVTVADRVFSFPEPPVNAWPEVGVLVGGRYALVRRIATGGMAEVWEAEDTVLSRPVAAKLLVGHLAADTAFVTRFRREAVAAARLSHPHVVSIYDTCAGEGGEAIVMELVRGGTVRAALDERGSFPVRQAVGVAVQVADGLAHAHARGLVHRDVKPSNILLSDDGRVLVTDFGIAKAAQEASDVTGAGQVVGTAKYLSPEQVQGQPLDPRSDVYSVGVVLYEMLCGRVPFRAENPTAMALARLTTVPLRPRQVRAGIPRRIEEVVLKAMARRPEDRYPSAADLRAALLAVELSGMEEPVHTASFDVIDSTPIARTAGPATGRRRFWLVPVGLIVVIGATLGIGVVVGRTRRGHDVFNPGPSPAATTGAAVSVGPAQTFDPGGGGDHPELLGALTDGDPSTAWYTHTYTTASFGGLKSGTGAVLPLVSATRVGTLTVASPAAGWKASVYVADAPQTTLAAWGSPVATLSGAGTVSLGGRTAGALLLWITDLGPAHRVVLSELHLTG